MHSDTAHGDERPPAWAQPPWSGVTQINTFTAAIPHLSSYPCASQVIRLQLSRGKVSDDWAVGVQIYSDRLILHTSFSHKHCSWQPKGTRLRRVNSPCFDASLEEQQTTQTLHSDGLMSGFTHRNPFSTLDPNFWASSITNYTGWKKDALLLEFMFQRQSKAVPWHVTHATSTPEPTCTYM